MRRRSLVVILSSLVFCMSGQVFGQSPNEIIFTIDPDKQAPTVVTEASQAAITNFISVNYTVTGGVPGAPVPFTMVFPSSFNGQFDEGGTGTGENPALTAKTVRPNGDIAFESATKINGQGADCKYTPPGTAVQHDCYWVKIKLTNAPGPATGSGFIYRVEMGNWGQVIDPRYRGK